MIDVAFTDHLANEHELIADTGADDAAAMEPILKGWLSVLKSLAG